MLRPGDMQPWRMGFHVLVTMAALSLVGAGCAQGTDGDGPTIERNTGASMDRVAAGDGGAPAADGSCGEERAPCCDGYCRAGLSCTEDGICERMACGADDEPCCTTGTPCLSGLTCAGSVCSASAPAACGHVREPCCSGGAACAAGLICDLGSCAEPVCGASGEPCCAPGTCDPGLTCAAGLCGTPAPPPPPPPPVDPCAGATDCLDCTDRSECGFCDGRCVVSDFFGPLDGSFCSTYAWFVFECLL